MLGIQYDTVATHTEIMAMSAQALKTLRGKLKSEQTWVDRKTFEPYRVVDRIRYNLDPPLSIVFGPSAHRSVVEKLYKNLFSE